MKSLGIAKRAVPDHVDVSIWDTCVNELSAIRLGKIDFPCSRLAKQFSHVRAYLITARADAWTDGGQHILGIGIQLA